MNIRKIRIILEEAYADSIWCKELLGGLQKELKKRRLASDIYTEFIVPDAEDAVCLIGMSNGWLKTVIEKYNVMDCQPIVLSAQAGRSVDGKYHLICPDMKAAAKGLKEAFVRAGRTKIAVYGANYSADLDKDRTAIFSELVDAPSDIYTNTGNLEACFRSFQKKAAFYDTVLCVNGYAALSLVKKLEKEHKELLEKIVILSCEEVLKHSKYNQWISLIDLKLESFGATAMTVMEMASLRSDISVITVRMNVNVSEIPGKVPAEHSDRETELQFYEDPEIIHMAKIEQLLRDADDMDHHIIAMLLDGATYGEIADNSYMTEGNVKYRVKKYMSTCDCKTKKELLELLQEYLQ